MIVFSLFFGFQNKLTAAQTVLWSLFATQEPGCFSVCSRVTKTPVWTGLKEGINILLEKCPHARGLCFDLVPTMR